MRAIAIACALSAAVSAGPVQNVFDGLLKSTAGVAAAPARSFWPPWAPRPPEPPRSIDLSKYTIGQILEWTLKHHGDDRYKTLPLHKLAWAVNQSSIAKRIYSNESISMTLFAPEDGGLERPRHGHHEHREHDEHPFYSLGHVDEDKERHERMVKIIEFLLMYHTIPEAYSAHELADHSTLATTLPSYKHAETHARVRLDAHLIPRPGLVVNLYSRSHVEVKAKNGYILLVSAPLLPPPGPLDLALLLPGAFSTLTSGIQLAELDRELSPGLHKYAKADAEQSVTELVRDVFAEILAETTGGAGVDVPPEYTVLAPTNLAFLRLGGKINAFLFSPWGRRVLKAVLSYHVLPGVTLHTDWQHNSTVHKQTEEINIDYDFGAAGLVEPEHEHMEQLGLAGLLPFKHPHPPHHDPPHDRPHPPSGKANVTHLHDVKTAYGEHTVDIDIVKYRIFGRGPIKRRVVVKPKGHNAGPPVPAIVADVVARSGAIHVLGKPLRPPMPKHHGDHGHHDFAGLF